MSCVCELVAVCKRTHDTGENSVEQILTCVEMKENIKAKDQKILFLVTVYFTYSPKGARMIVVEGFKFVRHYDTGEKTRWYCATHRSKGCRAALFTIGEEIVKINNLHVHNG
uniref:SFRICE_024364 n=1 Tax=Spodoptera frugiperda TaxID=7108 RepID=A0A2H1VZV4_SPOFR